MKKLLTILFLLLSTGVMAQSWISGATIQGQFGAGYTNLRASFAGKPLVPFYNKSQVDSVIAGFNIPYTAGYSILLSGHQFSLDSTIAVNKTFFNTNIPTAVKNNYLKLSGASQNVSQSPIFNNGFTISNGQFFLNGTNEQVRYGAHIKFMNPAGNAGLDLGVTSIAGGGQEQDFQSNKSGLIALTYQIDSAGMGYKLKSDSLPTTPSAFVTQNYLQNGNVFINGNYNFHNGALFMDNFYFTQGNREYIYNGSLIDFKPINPNTSGNYYLGAKTDSTTYIGRVGTVPYSNGLVEFNGNNMYDGNGVRFAKLSDIPGGSGSGTTVVNSITGTANQVIASSPSGAVTLSLPQDIGLTSRPTFLAEYLGNSSSPASTSGSSGTFIYSLNNRFTYKNLASGYNRSEYSNYGGDAVYKFPYLANSTLADSANTWAAIVAKQSQLTLTNTGNSGPATLTGGALNIPNYTLAGLGGEPAQNGTGYVKKASGATSYVTAIPNTDLANSTISGVSLGNNLNTLTFGRGFFPVTYNGASNVVAVYDTTKAYTLTNISNTFSPTYSNSTGIVNAIRITPTGTQTGAAASTDIMINATGTYGTGNQYFANWMNNGTSTFSVTRGGQLQLGAALVANGGAILNGGALAMSLTPTSGNLYVYNLGQISPTQSTTNFQFGNATTQLRAVFSGTSQNAGPSIVPITAGSNYTNVLVGDAPLATATTGTHAILSNLAVKPIGTITSNGATLPLTSTVWIGGQSTAGVVNYNLFSQSNGASTTNSYFKYGTTRVTGLQVDSVSKFASPVLIAGATDNGTDALQVNGNSTALGFRLNRSGNYITYAAPSTVASYTQTDPGAAPTTNGSVKSYTTAGVASWVALPSITKGQLTLSGGTASVTISGLTTTSIGVASIISIGGTVSTTWQYKVVCTANTLTITAITNTGSTDTTDTSTIGYHVIQ